MCFKNLLLCFRGKVGRCPVIRRFTGGSKLVWLFWRRGKSLARARRTTTLGCSTCGPVVIPTNLQRILNFFILKGEIKALSTNVVDINLTLSVTLLKSASPRFHYNVLCFYHSLVCIMRLLWEYSFLPSSLPIECGNAIHSAAKFVVAAVVHFLSGTFHAVSEHDV
jgi:hypothetical protein